MATVVYEKTELELMDGTQVSMRPLKISILREFMKKFDSISEVADNNEKSIDILVDCARIAMKQYNQDLAADKEKFEDVVDLKMVYKIIEVASGIKLDAEGNEAMAGILGTN
jgi:hypothetical protein